MKAVTTPAPLLVLNRAFTFPYHMYVELARRVPTESGGIVNNRLSLKMAGFPDETQSVLDESPRYFVSSVILSMVLKSDFVSLQTGAGTQASREKDDRGSQPPRQYAPTPQAPYSVSKRLVNGVEKELIMLPHPGDLLTRAARGVLGAFAREAAFSLRQNGRRSSEGRGNDRCANHYYVWGVKKRSRR